MVTMEFIDQLRDRANDLIERRRERIRVGANADEVSYLLRSITKQINAALAEWEAQGFKEAPAPPAPPQRCRCGAYPWPVNMAPNGTISDMASVHGAHGCAPRPLVAAGPQAAVECLAATLFDLQTSVETRYLDRERVDWRKRVIEAAIRRGEVVRADDPNALRVAERYYCCCGAWKLNKNGDDVYADGGRHGRNSCKP